MEVGIGSLVLRFVAGVFLEVDWMLDMEEARGLLLVSEMSGTGVEVEAGGQEFRGLLVEELLNVRFRWLGIGWWGCYLECEDMLGMDMELDKRSGEEGYGYGGGGDGSTIRGGGEGAWLSLSLCAGLGPGSAQCSVLSEVLVLSSYPRHVAMCHLE